MIPEPEYMKIDKKYIQLLYSLSLNDKAILFDRMLEYYAGEEITQIEDYKLNAIFDLLVLDFN